MRPFRWGRQRPQEPSPPPEANTADEAKREAADPPPPETQARPPQYQPARHHEPYDPPPGHEDQTGRSPTYTGPQHGIGPQHGHTGGAQQAHPQGQWYPQEQGYPQEQHGVTIRPGYPGDQQNGAGIPQAYTGEQQAYAEQVGKPYTRASLPQAYPDATEQRPTHPNGHPHGHPNSYATSWTGPRQPDGFGIPAGAVDAMRTGKPSFNGFGAANPAPPPGEGSEPWRPMAGEFAERVLMLVWAAVSQLAEVESTEQDPERLKRLYHTDHALTRIRRVAENLQVLAGGGVDDPGAQITSVLDVVRAAASAVEHYPRVHFGRIVDLAVTEVAADDVIRILTELIDNAVRYSPPSTPVIVSAHLTDAGHVLVRVEDSGIGVDPHQLPRLNAMLEGQAEPSPAELQAAHLGLPVVSRLTRFHRSLRVQISPRQPAGTTAMLLVGAELVCELPQNAMPQNAMPKDAMPNDARAFDAAATAVLPITRMDTPPPPVTAPAPMPRRVPSSVRATSGPPRSEPEPPAEQLPVHRQAWHDDAADFNAGIDAATTRNS